MLVKAWPVLSALVCIRQNTLAVPRESTRRSAEIPETIVKMSRPWLFFFPFLPEGLVQNTFKE